MIWIEKMERRDEILLWRDRWLPGRLELLRASCVDHRYPAHHHDEFVVAAFKGGAQKHRIERHVGVAYAGAVMVIPPGAVHTGEAAEPEGSWEYCAFYPNVETLETIADDISGRSQGDLDFGTDLVIEDRVMAAHLIAAHRVAETATDMLERQCAVMDAFGLLIRRYGRRSSGRRRPPPLDADISRAIAFMEANGDRQICVSEIASAAGLSDYYFMRTFRARTGMTVHGYLTQLRLRRAKDLLERGAPLAETAIAVGFFDQSHLTNRFRANYGVTPRQFAMACR
jgi:AraC-like DNA-binding protein